MSKSSHGTTPDIHVSVAVANQFLALWHEVHPFCNPTPKDIPRAIRQLLRKIKKGRQISDNHCFHGRWIFEIEGNVLKSVLAAPKISNHARKRLAERRDVSDSEATFTVALATINGRRLTVREKMKLRIRINTGTKHLLYEGLVYVIRNRTLVTVTPLNRGKSRHKHKK